MKTFILGLVLLAALQGAHGAVTAYLRTQVPDWSGRSGGNVVRFVCSTEAELPSGASTIDGDTAYTTDSGKRWERTAGAWVLQTTDSLATAIQESSGPSVLAIGSVTDGQYLRRVGATVVGAAGGGGGAAWGEITGTLSAQVDLQAALDAKLAANGNGSSLTGLTKSQVGLGSVDNTADASKSVASAATLTNSRNINGVAFNGSANITIPDIGYTLSVQALTSSPTDAQTVYFGQLPKAPITTAAVSRIYIRKAGTIKMANVFCYSGTAGTAEAWSLYIRLNNSTDTLIETIAAAASERTFDNSSLSIAVVAGDYIEIKSIQPTWATNPLTTIYGGYIYIE